MIEYDFETSEEKMTREKLLVLIKSIYDRVPHMVALGKPNACIDTEKCDPQKFCEDAFLAWEHESKMLLYFIDWESILPALEIMAKYRETIWPLYACEAWEMLPEDEDIRIYRGGKGPLGELCKGYSWSLHEGYANNFALKAGEDSMMATGLINRKDVLLYVGTEQEVVLRPELIRDIQEYHP